ncbi:MAG: NAD-dependent DNA ligase LigA [Chlamydiota bacterium]
MNPISDEKEYQKLVKELIHHDHLYYEKADPTISDYEYDQLFSRVDQFEKKHPEKIDPQSPTQRVSDPLTEGFTKRKHRTPMRSLANTYSAKELQEFIDRVKKTLGKEALSFSVELKMDGVAVSVIYKKGELSCALTRGNGTMGDDITNNMKTIRSLPLVLKGKQVPQDLELRGEVYLPIQHFQEMNLDREENGLSPWANPRNAAAGSLKLLSPREVQARKLKVVFYGAANVDAFSSQHEVHLALRKLGLPVAKEEHFARCETAQEILAFADKVKAARHKLPFEIDGIVVKVDTLAYHDRLGFTGKCPRSSVAYKFAPEQAETLIEEITLQMGRTGVLTPVAELRPTLLQGSLISRATLHNQEEIQRKDIRIGDAVVIEKGGDVIPKVVSVLRKKRPQKAKPWIMPQTCPFCDAPLEKHPDEVAVRCSNPTCPQIQLQRLIFYASKQGMDIGSLGVKVMRKLFETNLVQRFSDIYRLRKEDLESLPNFQEKSIQKLLSNIEESKRVPLHRFLLALGIQYVGKETAPLLEERAGTLSNLYRISKEDLLAIDGIGEKAAQSLITFLSDPTRRQEIEDLLSLGVEPIFSQEPIEEGHPFSGKSFVLTGSLQRYTREEAGKIIKQKGGLIKNSVSKKTDFLLVGEDPGSKLAKAEKLGVPILSEEEFRKQIERA